MKKPYVLSHEEARAFYDAFGSKQDLQRFYEDRAIDVLLDDALCESASAVAELGCGTGRLAERLLRERLSARATYDGFDVSPTMVRLAEARLKPWAGRARVHLTSGAPAIPLADSTCDRFLSTYVLDLLGEDEVRAALLEAARVLVPGGLLCLASLTFGESLPSRMLSRLWTAVHSRSPRLVGGCRPLRLAQFMPPGWLVAYREVVCSFGLCTEVLTGARVSRSSAGREARGEGPAKKEGSHA
ncbi:MAG TPA: class I SAM-dependent methyltransferase [Thermoanaerobaculia bacterium]|nr:class I SAM-dependent methyltransferase [Thermoanaerobaculia bacterium]